MAGAYLFYHFPLSCLHTIQILATVNHSFSDTSVVSLTPVSSSRYGAAFAFFFMFLGLLACTADRKAEVPKQGDGPRTVKCETNAFGLKNLCEDEVDYLKWAEAYPQFPRLQDLNREVLRQITVDTKDVDKAAALYFNRVMREPANRELVQYLDRMETSLATQRPNFSKKNLMLAMAPGMFYKDNPEIGADGRDLRNMALELGMKEAVIPVEQTGTVEENAKIICEFVQKQNEVKGIIIASVSKGSGDFKRAIQICGSEPYFKKVRGWFNIAGISRGSRLMTDIENTWTYKMEARGYFCWNGYNWDGFLSMRAGEGAPLETELKLPDHLLVVNVVAVPVFRMVTDRARPFYEYLVRYGPNDGMTFLVDSVILGGVIFPSWRNDHYFRFPMYRPRMHAFLVYIVERKFQEL